MPIPPFDAILLHSPSTSPSFWSVLTWGRCTGGLRRRPERGLGLQRHGSPWPCPHRRAVVPRYPYIPSPPRLPLVEERCCSPLSSSNAAAAEQGAASSYGNGEAGADGRHEAPLRTHSKSSTKCHSGFHPSHHRSCCRCSALDLRDPSPTCRHDKVGVSPGREHYIHRLGRIGREDKYGKGVPLIASWEEYFLNEMHDHLIEKSQPPHIDQEMKKV